MPNINLLIYFYGVSGNENDGISLGDLLIFITGASLIPPNGFDEPIIIKFFDKKPGEMRYPTASTCSMELYLPREFEDADEFKEYMDTAVTCAHGFGQI